MAQYFETFPKLLYDIDNTKNFKLVTDIFRRIKVREQLKENAALFSKYDVYLVVSNQKLHHINILAQQTISGLYYY